MSLWAIDVEGENAKYLLPAFTCATGLPVDAQSMAWTAAHEKMLTAYAGGSLPDVMMLSRGWLYEFTMIGAIVPVPVPPSDLLQDSFGTAGLAVGGKPMAVPWTLDLAVQYYRRDLLAAAGYDAPPATLDAWRDCLRAVKKRQGDDFCVLMQLNWPDHLLHIATQTGDPLLVDRDSRGNFASPGFRHALGFYLSLFDEGLAPRVSSIEAADPTGDLARGFVALYASGSWTRAELLRRQDAIPRDRWGTAPMAGRDGQAQATVAGAVLGVSSTAADPARAWSLIRHLTATEQELRLHRISGTLPSRPSAWATPSLANDPVMQTYRRALERPAPGRNIPEWDRITGEVQLVAEQLVRGRTTLDEACAEMNRRADAILAKRRWLLERGRIA